MEDIEKIQLSVKLWRDEINGNTYHTVAIRIDTEENSYVLPVNKVTYGYGSQYEVTIMEELKDYGIIKEDESSLYKYCKDNDIELDIQQKEVKRKSDLPFNGNDFDSKYDSLKDLRNLSNVKFSTKDTSLNSFDMH